MNITKIVLVAVALHISAFGFSQENTNFQLIDQVGGIGKDNGYALTIDGSGHLIATGSFSKELTTNLAKWDETGANDAFTSKPLTTKGSKDGIVMKYNQSDELIWVKQLSATTYLKSNVVSTNIVGTIFIAGTFMGDFTYTVEGVEKTLTSTGKDGSAFILEMNKNGEIEWARQFGGAEAILSFSELKIGTNNAIYLSGNFTGKTNFNTSPTWAEKRPEILICGDNEMEATNGFLLKLNYSGDFEWVKHISSDFDSFTTSMAVENDGAIYVSGTFEGSVSFSEDSEIPNAVGLDSYIVKYSQSGEIIWAKQVGSLGEERIASIALNSKNKLVVSGNFTTYIGELENEGDNIFLTLRSNGSLDGFVCLLNEGGDLQWIHHLKDDSDIYVQSITCKPNDNVLIAGYKKDGLRRKLLSKEITNVGFKTGDIITLGDWVNPAKIITNNETDQTYIIGDFSENIKLGSQKFDSKGSSDIFILKLK